MENYYQAILQKLAENTPVALETVISGEEGEIESGLSRRLTDVVPVADARGRRFARVTSEEADGRLTVREPVLPQERLIVLGGGHIALPVCRFGAACGFTVCVVDDRPDFANTERFPEASQVLCDSFENGIRRLKTEGQLADDLRGVHMKPAVGPFGQHGFHCVYWLYRSKLTVHRTDCHENGIGAKQ